MSFDRFWSPSELVPGTPADSYQPSVALLGGALHLMWSSDRVLYHSMRSAGSWSPPFPVAAGEQPSLVAAPHGGLHCLFAHPFLNNWEIYHVSFDGVSWSLPEPVSRTTGASTQPALVAGPDGVLHAAWADTTPGESVIYYGAREGAFWSSSPVPSGRGCQPAIALAPSGELCIAWQDRVSQTQAFDIYSSVLQQGKWSLPDMVSDTASAHSQKPCLATNKQGGLHLIWLEEEDSHFTVWHSDRRVNGWSAPTAVSVGAQDCRQARIIANPQGYLQVVWLEGNALHHRVRPPEIDATWWVPQTAEGDYRELSDLGIACSPTGELHVIWSGFEGGGTRALHWARREPIFRPAASAPRG
jgi:hypothetical protein